MEITRIPLSELTPDPENAKEHPSEQIEQIKNSIRQFGAIDPIGVWGPSNLIVEGHGRFLALQELGYDAADCIRLDSLTDEERRAYALAHNQLTMSSGFIPELLASDLEQIHGIDMRDFGFNPDAEWFNTDDDGTSDEDDEDYTNWLDKFKDKHTTDDCYTPAQVYDAVRDWVAKTYQLNPINFVRPFYPGGNYQAEKYTARSVVVDNPPFSILSEIVRWYISHRVRFFLFCDGRYPPKVDGCTLLATGVAITYANGADVNTSFITNLEPSDIVARSAPDLYAVVKQGADAALAEMRNPQPVYKYPDNVISAAHLIKLSKYGVPFEINKKTAATLSNLDAQKGTGKGIFGRAWLLSDGKAAERAAAERAAAERAAAERAAAERAAAERAAIAQEGATVWTLSQRELDIVAELSKHDTPPAPVND